MRKGHIIYQMFLRATTRGGTLASATGLLKHVSETGATIVYLCPVFDADPDERQNFWSARQRACNLNNPKNPYRMNDYYKIDQEYGTDEDLNNFVKAAHKYGLKVILDLVYYHCGPTSELMKINPNFVKRLPNGEPDCGKWDFPMINFDCPELCEYLWSNMEYFVREFDVDGYRCDVGDKVPLSFWQEGKKRIAAIKPEILMLNEGKNTEYIQSKVFDMEYYLSWGEDTLEQVRDKFTDLLGDIPWRDQRVICFENHDAVNDAAEERLDKKHGFALCNALLTVMFTCGCVPFIYNGNEIADISHNSIYANRFIVKDMHIDWSFAVTEKGKRRMDLLRRLSSIYLNIPAIVNGDFKLLHDVKGVIAYTKSFKGQEIYVAVNLSEKLSKLPLCDSFDTENTETLISSGVALDNDTLLLEGGAYIVMLK